MFTIYNFFTVVSDIPGWICSFSIYNLCAQRASLIIPYALSTSYAHCATNAVLSSNFLLITHKDHPPIPNMEQTSRPISTKAVSVFLF